MTIKHLDWKFLIFLLIFAPAFADAQPGVVFDLPKPKKFENRKLASEKSGDKKFTIPRRFMQNTTTHYNYYFNANEKIKMILDRAKTGHKDDYTKLLSFYPFDFDETARYKTELDSVIFKSTTGIMIHDLRSNWVDNLYLLIGEAYYYRKLFDSAYMSFQYLNYAFSPKEKDGYAKVIGSNSNASEGGNVLTISTNEKVNIVKKTLSRPPSRNESLIWLVKTYLAADKLTEAAGLIQTLKKDPLFPNRLQSDLSEVEAWYFYKQNMYDSAAIYLEPALSNAASKQEYARGEYLIGQLYEKAGNHAAAKEFYVRVTNHTINPVMEVYALLNSLRQVNQDDKSIQNAVENLDKMGRRDKYLDFHDIIYYTAADIELSRNRPDAAKVFLQKSIKSSVNNATQKSKSFYALANIEFSQKDFANAKKHYDSVGLSAIASEEAEAFRNRKEALGAITKQLNIIARQDSLQHLAALPPAERDLYLKKLLKQLRKQQGLKEEEVSFGNTGGLGNNNPAADLFGAPDAKADWYFSNASLKQKGFGEFKSKWGNRPNVDNWQRSAAIKQATQAGKNGLPLEQVANDAGNAAEYKPLTLETLQSNIPLTPEKMKISNDSIMHAKFELGKALQEGLEDYFAAIEVYEKLLQAFPHAPVEEQTLFNLYYCYKKTGNDSKMLEIKKAMEGSFGSNKLTAIIKDPNAADSLHKKDGTAQYDNIYTLFIEGKFEEALHKKQAADSLYGKFFWSPQLLYIEAVYHVNQRDDSSAKKVLNNINTLYPGTGMAAKAKKLLEVLGRRKEIETYLTNLQLKMPVEDSTGAITENKSVPNLPVASNPTPVQNIVKKAPDSSLAKTSKDSVALAKKPVINTSGYTHTPEKQHLVLLIMDKVDPVYITEAKNAFVRYNKETYYNKPIETTPLALSDDIRLLLIGKFDNADAALEYLGKARKLAPAEIIPWMPAVKYSFVIITENNLELLKTIKDIPAYKKFISQNYPGRF